VALLGTVVTYLVVLLTAQPGTEPPVCNCTLITANNLTTPTTPALLLKTNKGSQNIHRQYGEKIIELV
jgi:hypothetical protein